MDALNSAAPVPSARYANLAKQLRKQGHDIANDDYEALDWIRDVLSSEVSITLDANA